MTEKTAEEQVALDLWTSVKAGWAAETSNTGGVDKGVTTSVKDRANRAFHGVKAALGDAFRGNASAGQATLNGIQSLTGHSPRQMIAAAVVEGAQTESEQDKAVAVRVIPFQAGRAARITRNHANANKGYAVVWGMIAFAMIKSPSWFFTSSLCMLPGLLGSKNAFTEQAPEIQKQAASLNKKLGKLRKEIHSTPVIFGALAAAVLVGRFGGLPTGLAKLLVIGGALPLAACDGHYWGTEIK